MKVSSRMTCAGTILAGALLAAGCSDPGPGWAGPASSRGALATAPPSADGAYLRQVISRGGPFHASNGLLFAANDDLVVASVLSRSLFVIDPRSGRILDPIGPERGVESPDDLAFGPDGSLYWTAFFTGEVGRLTPGGVKSTVARLGPGVNAITFSPDGRLFVTRVFLGDELWELDPEGALPPRRVAAGLGGLNGMDFGPDGELYGPLWFKGQVARIDVETGAVTPICSGIATPAAVKFDSAGRLHLVDQGPGHILAVDLATGLTSVVGHPGAGADNLAFDSADRLFVSNSHDGSIVEVLPNLTVRTVVPGGLVAPGGVAVRAGAMNDEVFVADSLAMRQLDGHRGTELEVFHSVIGLTPLATPLTVAADGANLVTSSWFANVVQVFDPASGAVLETHRDFATPLNAIRFQGDLVVAEVSSHTVSRKDHATGVRTVIAALPVPTGLAAAGDNLFAADWATGRIVQLYSAGVLLSPPRLVASGLVHPEGLAVDEDGSLLAVETGTGRLLRIDPASGALHVIDEALSLGLAGAPGLPPTYVFNGVAVGDCGAIYLTLDATNELARFTPRGAGGRCAAE